MTTTPQLSAQHIDNIRRIQRRLNVEDNGIPGPETLDAFILLAEEAERYRGLRDDDSDRDTLPTGYPAFED